MLKAAAFDYSKVDTMVHVPSEDKQYPTEQIDIRKSVDAALSDFNTKLFLARYDSDELFAYVSYVTPEQISSIPDTLKNPSLPDSSDAIGVWFYSDGGVPEQVLVVYLQLETYRVYGVVNMVG